MAALAIPHRASIDTESIVAADLAQFGRRTYVMSMHFMPLGGLVTQKAVRQYKTLKSGGFFTNYRLPAVLKPTDRPNVLVCLDGYQDEITGTNENTYQKIHKLSQVASRDIGEDMVNEMTGARSIGPDGVDDTGIARPAVWISDCPKIPPVEVSRLGETIYHTDWEAWGMPEFAEEYPDFTAEVAAYVRREWAHCEANVRAADAWHSGPTRNPININERHHLSAAYIGATVEEHGWMSQTSFGKQIACPFCGQSTSSAHPKCQNPGCGEIINPELYARVKARIGAV